VDWDLVSRNFHLFQEAVVEDLILHLDLKKYIAFKSGSNISFESCFSLLSMEQISNIFKRALLPKDKRRLIEAISEKDKVMLTSSTRGLNTNFLITKFVLDEEGVKFEHILLLLIHPYILPAPSLGSKFPLF
jgi:hypothetical protein